MKFTFIPTSIEWVETVLNQTPLAFAVGEAMRTSARDRSVQGPSQELFACPLPGVATKTLDWIYAMTNKKRISSSERARTVDNWDRVSGESSKAFQAFAAYRDLPVEERRLTKVSQTLGKARSLCARWSTQFRWQERVQEHDRQQDELRRRRAEAERNKILERQLQHNRIASQALVAPLIALTKRAQSGANAFAGASDLELAKIASLAARALPRVHEDERSLVIIPEQQNSASPTTIVGAEFTWVQSACLCGHAWDSHDQIAPTANVSVTMPCTAPGCSCTGFKESGSTIN